MNQTSFGRFRALTICIAISAQIALSPALRAQESSSYTISVTPASLQMSAGEQAEIETSVLDASGEPVEAEVRLFGRGDGLEVSSDGVVKATAGGSFSILVFARPTEGSFLRSEVPVEVSWPPVVNIETTEYPDRFYAGNTYRVRTEAIVEGGLVRTEIV
ncbi:MAG: hypothetical protein ACWGON_04025, partial [Gemmatimonadota bacterium]